MASPLGPVGRPYDFALGADRPRPQLTDREKQFLRLACDGLTNEEIAARLGISLETVKSGFRAIFRKLHVNDRTLAAAPFVERSLVQGPVRGACSTDVPHRPAL